MASVSFKRVTGLLGRLPKSIDTVARAQVLTTANALIRDLQQASPVDSGTFRGNWWIARRGKTGNVLASMSVQNRMIYGHPIELGSPVGHRPWPTARSPKTVELNGRVYSSQAVGGVIKQVNLERHAKELAERINSAIKGNMK